MTGEQIMREVFMAGVHAVGTHPRDDYERRFQGWMRTRGDDLLLYIIFGTPEPGVKASESDASDGV